MSYCLSMFPDRTASGKPWVKLPDPTQGQTSVASCPVPTNIKRSRNKLFIGTLRFLFAIIGARSGKVYLLFRLFLCTYVLFFCSFLMTYWCHQPWTRSLTLSVTSRTLASQNETLCLFTDVFPCGDQPNEHARASVRSRARRDDLWSLQKTEVLWTDYPDCRRTMKTEKKEKWAKKEKDSTVHNRTWDREPSRVHPLYKRVSCSPLQLKGLLGYIL